ncbi:MAG: winged helix-turn-helix domain-containing protein, partial [Acidobacteriota bacterium]
MNPQEMSRQDDFLIGAWHVQPGLLRLQGPDGTVELEPRAMSVLVVLKEHAGQVVSRQRLHDLAWADATVSDETINRTIFDLRQGLGDRASDPRFIETIRKVGYRLIAPIEPAPMPIPTPVSTPARHRPETGRRRLGWLLAALAIGGVSAAITAGFSNPPSTASMPVEPPRQRQLTSYPGYETTPAISPDGRRLAFAWDGGHAGNVDIYWRDLDGSRSPVRLTDDRRRDDGPAFSSDGERLAFVRSEPGHCQL